jgi:RNA processing factor Prp31
MTLGLCSKNHRLTILHSARIDNFSEHPSKKFGDVLRGQVEDRLEFYATGKKPTKNQDAMVRSNTRSVPFDLLANA